MKKRVLFNRFFVCTLSLFMLCPVLSVGISADNNVGAYGTGAYKDGEYYKFTQSQSKKAELVSVNEKGELVFQ